MDPGSPEPMLKAKGFGKKLASNRMRDNSAKRNRQSTTDDDEAVISCLGKRRVNQGGARHRLVTKSGESNFASSTAKGDDSSTTFVGLFTHLVDAKWRWTWLVFFGTFYISWLIFAIVFYIICFAHGDFDFPLEAGAHSELSNGTFIPCLDNVKDFTSVFLFSLEIQTTIGFGYSRVTEQCPPAVITLTIQAILGVIIEAFLVGVVFAKIVRTKQRAQAIVFSQRGIICKQDGLLCLMFRLADRHTSRIIAARLRATLVRRTRTTREGHAISLEQQPLNIHPSGEDSDLLLLWPVTVVHPITAESPLYGISATSLIQDDFEIIVTLEGTTASTNMAAQAVTSYLPNEILWGYRFDEMFSTESDTARPTVDFSQIDKVYPVEISVRYSGYQVEMEPVSV